MGKNEITQDLGTQQRAIELENDRDELRKAFDKFIGKYKDHVAGFYIVKCKDQTNWNLEVIIEAEVIRQGDICSRTNPNRPQNYLK